MLRVPPVFIDFFNQGISPAVCTKYRYHINYELSFFNNQISENHLNTENF